METIDLQYSSSSGPEGVGFVAGAGDGRRIQAHRESGSYVVHEFKDHVQCIG